MILVVMLERFRSKAFVRLKITKQLAGSIDGLHLDRFAVGGVYDVGTSLANYLLAIGAAEPVGDGPAKRDVGMEHHELLNGLRRRLNGDAPTQEKASDDKRRPGKRR
jgi:hypothetical protein